MTRAHHSAAEKDQAIRHVGYSVHMAAEAAANIRDDQEWYAHNAAIEVMLLHGRALGEFFTFGAGRGYPTDIRRTDFVSDEGWEKPTDALARVEADMPLINKHLVHLTWERVKVQQAEWTYIRISKDLVDIADSWSRHLNTASRPLYEAFRPQVFFARQALARRNDP